MFFRKFIRLQVVGLPGLPGLPCRRCRHGKDPALEGAAVLELGLRLVKECEEGDLESADLVWAPGSPGWTDESCML